MEHPSHRGGPPPWLTGAVIRVAGVVLGVSALLWAAARIRSLLLMLFVALFVAIALEPAVQRLSSRGWRRGLAAGLVFVAAFLAFVGFIAALVPLVVDQTQEIVEDAPGYVASLESWLDTQDLFDVEVIGDQILGGVEDLGGMTSRLGSQLAGGIFAVGNTVIGGVFALFTVALFAFYMVADGPRMRRTVLSLLPPDRQRELLRIWEIAVAKTGGYIYSRLVLAVVASIASGIVFALLGLPSVLALAIWVGVVSQFVPVVGAYLAGFLPALVALGSDPIDVLWVAVTLVVYQQIENSFVAPKITARSMSLHPAVSLASVIAGASLLGPLGAVLALPVAATVQAVLSTALERHDVVDSSATNRPPDGFGDGGGTPAPGEGAMDAGERPPASGDRTAVEGVGSVGEDLEA